ncbi:hypothetical protein GQ600_17580 [Phytophthora cactorum]|nr:hypothetical protein GQ600_17580 [Phytophthora cactorum]
MSHSSLETHRHHGTGRAAAWRRDCSPSATSGPLDGGELSEDDFTSRRRLERKNPSWIVVLGAGVAMLLIVHILFVALLRKTMVALDKLTLPDLCHRKTVGEVVMEFQNPSYCSPVKDTAFLHLQVPAFELQSGVTTMISPLLTEPEVFYSLVFADADTIDVHGEIPVLISCMLVPFTIHLDVSNLLRETSRPRLIRLYLRSGDMRWTHRCMELTCGIGCRKRDQRRAATCCDAVCIKGVVESPITFSEGSICRKATILVAGFKRFILGNGQTFISAYTEVFKNQSEPLQSMLQSYLAVTISSSTARLEDTQVFAGAKSLDQINNPLPIHFNLYGIELDLLYEKDTSKDHSSPKFLVHVKDIKHVSWLSHEENSIELVAAVHASTLASRWWGFICTISWCSTYGMVTFPWVPAAETSVSHSQPKASIFILASQTTAPRQHLSPRNDEQLDVEVHV